MTDPLKVSFQFSASDLAEVSSRSVADSPVVKRWRLQTRFVTAVGALAAIGLLWYAFAPATLLEKIGFPVIVCGMTALYLYSCSRSHNRHDRLLQYYRDKLGGDGPFDCEVELTLEGVISSQLGAEQKHAWTQVISVAEVELGIEFKYKPMGMLIVRNRAFGSADARHEFLRFAQKQIGQTRGIAALDTVP